MGTYEELLKKIYKENYTETKKKVKKLKKEKEKYNFRLLEIERLSESLKNNNISTELMRSIVKRNSRKRARVVGNIMQLGGHIFLVIVAVLGFSFSWVLNAVDNQSIMLTEQSVAIRLSHLEKNEQEDLIEEIGRDIDNFNNEKMEMSSSINYYVYLVVLLFLVEGAMIYSDSHERKYIIALKDVLLYRDNERKINNTEEP